MRVILSIVAIFFTQLGLIAQQCGTQGNESVYGSNDVWIGYVYKNKNLNNYQGYVTESLNFDQNFGGTTTSYNTNGCAVNTGNFSVRYRLAKSFAYGSYQFTVGGDDGYRLSLDGGSTWVINNWNGNTYTTSTYTTTLSGNVNMVLEYQNGNGTKRVSFNVTAICSASGNTSVYGTNNVWIGYVYDGTNFQTYVGSVTEGNTSSLNFDQNFGGDNVSYATSGCVIQTETFSVRYRLNKTFAPGTYQFTVGGDDGYRLSFDGGATWAINNWGDHSYSTTTITQALSGSVNMVLEYYENGANNRISISMVELCVPTGNPSEYGLNNTWRGYVYDGNNFETYVGFITEGTSASPDFDQDFGGNEVTYNTSSCGIHTETFSIRYRLRKTFQDGNYIFTVGGDDGFRLSLDGGATWIINRWVLQTYTTVTTNAIPLNGTYNMVLEYYENTGVNRVSFAMQTLTILPGQLDFFNAQESGSLNRLTWKPAAENGIRYFEVQKSKNGTDFESAGIVEVNNSQSNNGFEFNDTEPGAGITYYRLRIVDQYNAESFSKVINLRRKDNTNSIKLYPTEVTGNSVFLKSSVNLANAHISIHDLYGKTISVQKLGAVKANQEVSVPINTGIMHRGIYTVRLSDVNVDKSFTSRIMVP